jgi:endonuclease/exonuclease/phosphatase family metal-dependent hydrolase
VQVAQAHELVNGPADTAMPTVIVGDVNASPVDPEPSAYGELILAGLADAWIAAGEGNGLTCCQDDGLLNATSSLDTRIDVVLLRGDVAARAITVVGASSDDRTTSGLWPSDHAGVVATLEVSPP